MKKHVLRACLLLMACVSAQVVGAEEEERMFLIIQLNSGKTESVMLGSDGNNAERAMLHRQEGVLVVGDNVYELSEVKGLRIEPRMVDGIEVYSQFLPEGKGEEENAIYDLQGRKVGDVSGRNGGQPLQLPKGIYIVNGKKVVVR